MAYDPELTANLVAQFEDPTIKRLVQGSTLSDGCWTWNKFRKNGYGMIMIKTSEGWRPKGCHRVGYEILIGPVPEGLDLDHLCRVRNCWRPNHLEPVTRKENVARGLKAHVGPPAEASAKGRANSWANARARKECRRGHPYTEENTYWHNGKRSCKQCKHENFLRAYEPFRTGRFKKVCSKGHPYPEGTEGTARRCKTCYYEWVEKRKQSGVK